MNRDLAIKLDVAGNEGLEASDGSKDVMAI